VHGLQGLQQGRHRVMQTAYRGERGGAKLHRLSPGRASGAEGENRPHTGEGGGGDPVEEGRAPPSIRMDPVREPLAAGSLQRRPAAVARCNTLKIPSLK
jgi:hypothetical protein